MGTLMSKSTMIGDALYEIHRQYGDNGDAIIEWAKERLYGRIVEDHLVLFRELWQYLSDNGHTNRESSVSYGDADVYVWAEQLDTNTKLIIADDVVTCADDNVTIFKMKEYDFGEGKEEVEKLLFEFHVFTAFPQEKRNNFNFGDHRDINEPSLETIRVHNFEYGYGDGRDKIHVLKMTYSIQGARVEKAHWTEDRIKGILRNLRWYHASMNAE